jgi:small ligand-binding sensory domain FIST
MPFAAALSLVPSSLQAVAEVCDCAGAGLGGPPDLAMLFFSAHHAEHARDLAEEVDRRLGPKAALGCVAEAVIGGSREVEQEPALSLWLARWAGSVRLEPFHLTLERTADGPSLLGWPDALLGDALAPPEPFAPPRSAVLLLGDPFTFPADLFLQRMNEDCQGVPVLGGMASGIRQAGDCKLIAGPEVRTEGAAGVLLEGDIGLRWIVSQGCRPIGRPLVITKAQQNVILEMGGRTPLDHLRELWPTLSSEDQELFRGGLHLGRVLNEYQSDFQRGDFLIRNVLGLEKQTGALIINDHVRVGQTVQFQVRDAASADEDLHALLQLPGSGRDTAGGILRQRGAGPGGGTELHPRLHR